MFSEQFAFDRPMLVNFVGGGGKTPLILKLLEEYSHSAPAVYTTTTRIHPPETADGLVLIGCDDPQLLRSMMENSIRNSAGQMRRLVVTRTTIAPRLLGGVDPGFALTLDRSLFPVILNEADGARSMSLKMPREGEPVLMEGANYLVPVIGLDCLMKPLGPETLFRWEMAAARFSLKEGQILTPELASNLLMHPQGVCKHWKPGMQIIPYINKVDEEEQDALAKEVAQAMLQNKAFPIKRLVLGSLLTDRAFCFPSLST